MNADQRAGNLRAAKLTGATLLREFLSHRVAPLQAHSRPLWRLEDADAVLHLSSAALADEDLTAALRFLVGEDVASPEGAPVPLFLHDNWERVVDTMPTFDGVGLVPAEAPEGQAATTMVDLSSDDFGRGEEEDEEEEEERDAEATIEGMGETSPWRRSSALCSLPDHDEVGARRGGRTRP